MAISKYVSKINYINHNQEVVFTHLSNFENLGNYISEGLLDKISAVVPQIKITEFESDRDSCRFKVSGLGLANIRIIEREPFKTIKVEGGGNLPLGFTFWIQLVPEAESSTKMRLTLHADMNMMIKMMLGDKLDAGLNQLAATLAGLPYEKSVK